MTGVKYIWLDKDTNLLVNGLSFKCGEEIPHNQISQQRLDYFVELGLMQRIQKSVVKPQPPAPVQPYVIPVSKNEPVTEEPKKRRGRPRRPKK